MASSKLPTTAKAMAVMRAGSQSIAAQARAADYCNASLAGCTWMRLRYFQ